MSIPTSTSQVSPVHSEQIAQLRPISLAKLNEVAALQTRTDRKYILDGGQLERMLTTFGGDLAVLELARRRSFAYESIYFDTPDLGCFHSAAYGRRKRFKVRTRSYIDSQVSMLEVKTRGTRGGTVKRRQAHNFAERSELDREALDFVDSLVDRSDLASTLRPVLTTTYDRTTLVDLEDITRVTIDIGLRCTDRAGRSTGLATSFVVETKSAGAPSRTDRHLWANGIRPTKISKFGTGMAALDPSLPSNKWNRTLNQHFH